MEIRIADTLRGAALTFALVFLRKHDLIAALGNLFQSFGKQQISGQVFGALGQAGINIRWITQSPDELNIIFGVDNKDFSKAIRTLYDSFAK